MAIDAARDGDLEQRLDIAKRQEVVDVAHSTYARGLSPGSSGNISVRLDSRHILITPTESSLGWVEPDQLVKLDLTDGKANGGRPSKEWHLHRALYEHGDVEAVVHLHSSYAVAAASLSGLPDENPLPPLTPYFVTQVGHLGLVPYFRPGDPAGVAYLAEALAHGRSALMRNHGLICGGSSLSQALFAAEELEETCKLFLLLHDRPWQGLTDEQQAELQGR